MKDSTKKYLDKAWRSIRAAEILLVSSEVEFAVSRAYYAMFYVAEALLIESDLSFSKHGAVHGAFGAQFAKTKLLDPKFHRWLLDDSTKERKATMTLMFLSQLTKQKR